MTQSITSHLIYISKLVDELDMQRVNKMDDSKDLDLSLIEKIESRFKVIELESINHDDKVIFYYTISNYQAILKDLTIRDFELMKKTSSIVKCFKNLDEFVFRNYSERIDEYRKAIYLIREDSKLHKLFISQIYVNLANVFLEMGRVVESIETLNAVNKLVKHFPMAKGNLAMKHHSLSTRITDESVRSFLLNRGLEEIRETIDNSTQDLVPLDIIENFYDWEHYFEFSIDSNVTDVEAWTRSSDVDDEYKNWSAKNNLSLNYINVIYPFGNVDNIHMPNMGIGYFKDSNDMEYYAWLNAIKQEYNMARYFLYDIENKDYYGEPHESQQFNVLVNTLDYPAIGYKTEMLKNSLKTSFSVLDKIGLFCCHFHGLEMKVHQIDFHKWYRQIKMDIALGSPFNALYWLSQDLDTKNGSMKDIRLLRNCLEHRYIRVMDACLIPLSEELADDNKYEYKVSFYDLEKKAYETLRLVRSAIFYMVSGFNIEFNRLYYDKNRERIFLPLTITEYDDDWKK